MCSFFDPSETERKIGSYRVLWLIDEKYGQELPYVYLGFWIDGGSNLADKSPLKPLERITPDCWVPMD